MKPRSHLSAILVRGALRNPSPDLCAFTCAVAMAPRKYQQCGEAAKASRKSAKAKASQARATPSPKGKAPALGDPKAFPPLGKAADTRPPPPRFPNPKPVAGLLPRLVGWRRLVLAGILPRRPHLPPILSPAVGKFAQLSGDLSRVVLPPRLTLAGLHPRRSSCPVARLQLGRPIHLAGILSRVVRSVPIRQLVAN